MKVMGNGPSQVRHSANEIFSLRNSAWRRIQQHLGWSAVGEVSGSLHDLRRICVLASSSRGGTSVTAEFFQWQGADCDVPSGRMLTLPGEEKPHLVLSGLAFPTRRQLFDDLGPEDANQHSIARLLAEMTSEIGYPLAHCVDLDLYSLQLYRRLLLQWPLDMIGLEPGAAIQALADALRRSFGDQYTDSVSQRRRVLECCIECFPFVRGAFYDCSSEKQLADAGRLEQGAWSLEETPFVLPPPWHNATPNEVAEGTLLLRDPSNAWRLRFWKAVFSAQEMVVLHLARDVRESIQGLCDGWNYPFGFQTLPSDAPLAIAGYTDESIGQGAAWKGHRLNFSVDRRLSQQLLARRRAMPLVEVCGHQWLYAHECILEAADALSLRRIVLPFAALRDNPTGVFKDICRGLGLEVSRSGLTYAKSFPSRWVMATVVDPTAGQGRWRRSRYARDIRRIAQRADFVSLTRRLQAATVSQTGERDRSALRHSMPDVHASA